MAYKGYLKKDAIRNYFPMPNAIFNLGLTTGELAVYAYLMFCENRKTYQCYPSFRTIGAAVDMSRPTVKKHVDGLVEKGLIYTEPTSIFTKAGKKAEWKPALYDGFFELYLTELTTGLRIGELLALQWDDINFRTGAVNVSKQATMAKGKMQITTPKTQSSIRTVYLSKPVLEALKEYRKTVDSQWVFPSQRRDELPLHPSAVRKRLHATLERAGCKDVRFHDLRHTFATMALENGMDVKTLSAMLGHVSSATTLDVYSHVTDTMQEKAAVSIDRKIGKTDARYHEESKTTVVDQRGFKAVEGNRRRPGTGCLHQISEYLWEGRYSRKDEEGKRVARTVYGKTKEECEEKLAALVESMKAEKIAGNHPDKSQDLGMQILAM